MRYFGGAIGHQQGLELKCPTASSDDEWDEDTDAMDVDSPTPDANEDEVTTRYTELGNEQENQENQDWDNMDAASDSDESKSDTSDTDTDSDNSERYGDFGPEDDDGSDL